MAGCEAVALNQTNASVGTCSIERSLSRVDAQDGPIAVGSCRRMPCRRRLAAAARLAAPRWPVLLRLSFSSLTRRIVFLNLAGLVVLVAGILYLNQFRDGLIDARVAEPDDAGRDHRRRDRRLGDGRDRRDHHRSRQAARAAGRRELGVPTMLDNLDFPINPERVAPVLRRLISPTRTPRPHLRPRRQAAARLPPSLLPRRHPALSTCRRRPTKSPAWLERGLDRDPRPGSIAATCRSIASSAPTTARATRKSRRR